MYIPLAESLLGRFAGVPLLHLTLWLLLVAVTLVAIALVISRWGKTRPLHTCAVLSLLAHVLLGCVATIVRLVTAVDQVAEGPPVRVRLVQEVVEPVSPVAQPTTIDETPLPEPVEPTPPVDESDQPADESPPADQPPPSQSVEVEPTAEPATIETLSQTPTNQAQANQTQTNPEQSISPEPPQTFDAPPPAPVEQFDVVPVPTADPELLVSDNESPPQPYANRERSDRLGFVLREGGSRETEQAVRAALVWLAAAQSNDGRWDASRYEAGQEHHVLGHQRHGAGTQADTGITALALLAYLGAGHSHQQGEYRSTVRAGLQFLIDQQAADGNLAGDARFYARMYCHSMATFALAEAFAITKDAQLEPVVRRALDYSLRAQHPSDGGWRYRPGDSGDTSQLGWQLMALRSAELAGIQLPPATWTGVERFLRSVARGKSGGRASYRPDGPPSRTMTAEALYCRQLLAEAVGGRVSDRAAIEATENVLEELPSDQSINLYYWYYATLALHHQQTASAASERAWQTWNDAMKSTLVAAQVKRGQDTGSWAPNTVWGGYGGRVYSTALSALCLEVYYRYMPTAVDAEPWIATGPGESTLSR